QLAVIDLGATGAVYTGPLAGLGSRDLGVFGPGEARTYRFTATLPDTGIPPTPLGGDNAYQGASLRNTYVWTGTELDTQPVAPGGNPPGGNPSGRGPGKTAPLQLRVGLVRRQPAFKKRKLVFKITCNYACSFNATGRLAKGRVRLRGRARASHRHQATLTLRISKKSAKRLARALRSRRGTAMTLIVVARDASGRKVTFRRAVALKQVGRGRRAKVRMTWQKPPKPKKKKARR
ncbi:MAG: hypothetical protein QOF58_3084, partial [Pseudonocardiales bacterium]|nr:hypothetical protein [Pseudonocardiales bacterium]